MVQPHLKSNVYTSFQLENTGEQNYRQKSIPGSNGGSRKWKTCILVMNWFIGLGI